MLGGFAFGGAGAWEWMGIGGRCVSGVSVVVLLEGALGSWGGLLLVLGLGVARAYDQLEDFLVFMNHMGIGDPHLFECHLGHLEGNHGFVWCHCGPNGFRHMISKRHN